VPDLGRLVVRVADLHLERGRGEQLDDAVVDGPLDDDAGSGAAILAAVVEDRIGRFGGEAFEVRIGEDDIGALAAELQADLLDVAGSRPHDLLPVAVSPVKATLPIPGCAAIAAPAVEPGPVTTFRTPGGKPASRASSATRIAVRGV